MPLILTITLSTVLAATMALTLKGALKFFQIRFGRSLSDAYIWTFIFPVIIVSTTIVVPRLKTYFGLPEFTNFI